MENLKPLKERELGLTKGSRAHAGRRREEPRSHATDTSLDSRSLGAPRRAHAVDLLRRLLAAGPRPASDVRRLGEDSGLNWRTLQRASTLLHVRRQKADMAEGWLWSLPEPVGEGDKPVGAFGGATRDMEQTQRMPCLAAYRLEVPNDGLMHGFPDGEWWPS